MLASGFLPATVSTHCTGFLIGSQITPKFPHPWGPDLHLIYNHNLEKAVNICGFFGVTGQKDRHQTDALLLSARTQLA